MSSIRPIANAKVQAAIDAAIRDGREVGLQVAAYLGEELVIDAWGGLADPSACDCRGERLCEKDERANRAMGEGTP